MAEFDFLIVGYGLAGSALTHHLQKLECKLAVIDLSKETTSSKVAAGLYNPITGRKMVKTWRADDLFPFAINYYSEIEKNTNTHFLIEKVIYRPFHSIEEQNEWVARTAEEGFKAYINKVHQKSISDNYSDQYGGIELLQSGFLMVKDYLKVSKDYLLDKGVLFLNEGFNHSDLIISEHEIKYKEFVANKIIFCEGVETMSNPYFSWLPFKPVKGEILSIESEIDSSLIINRGVFVIPEYENRFKVGSTYDNNDLTLTPTSKGRAQIEDKLKELINVEYSVKNHYVGIRPATKDRKPFIGMHPNLDKVGIFNGLGAKGVSLAPYFANQFAQYLVNQSELDKEVNIDRYFSLLKN
jgi:glycine/D-amino acid oxidase-like deaminating enzyme